MTGQLSFPPGVGGSRTSKYPTEEAPADKKAVGYRFRPRLGYDALSSFSGRSMGGSRNDGDVETKALSVL